MSVGASYHKAQFLYDPSILSRSQPRVLFALCARAHHLAGTEDQGGGAGLADAHNDGREPFRIVLGVSGVQCDFLEVELAVEIDGGHNISGNENGQFVGL